MKRHELMDEQWALVDPCVPRSKARTGRPPSDPRLMLNGIFWILRIIESLQVKLDEKCLIDWELWCVDGANVRGARAAAGADKKVSTGTLTSRRTTLWAAAEAGLDRSFTWLLTARALRLPWKSPLARCMNRRGPSRSSARRSRA